jgi:hypothetical protein
MAGAVTLGGGGVAACGTGVGCLAGAPAIAGSVALAGHGAIQASNAIVETGKLSNVLMARGGAEKEPPLPLGNFKTQNDLGKYMGWGTGKNAAEKAASGLTLEKVRGSGLSLDDAQAWLKRYQDVFKDNPANGSAEGRITFMQRFIELLTSGE